jgi:uncharacterized FlaG/YvyC family protein
MEPIVFLHNNSLISLEELENYTKKLTEEIKYMNTTVNLQYEDDRASINLPDDKQTLKKVKKLINTKYMKNTRFNK